MDAEVLGAQERDADQPGRGARRSGSAWVLPWWIGLDKGGWCG
jgi:hypothetical protein